jgi:hypothetical protein
MATLITPTTIARTALATLYNTALLAGIVHRDYDEAFNGKVGDTVNVRVPATFAAKVFNRADGIELQDPTESTIPVVLDTILDVSFPVTTEELTLEIDSFDERLLTPAMEAIVQDVDGRLAEKLVDAANDTGGGGVVTGTGSSAGDRHAAFRKARRVLSRNKIPLTNRMAVLSPEGVEAITGDTVVLQANTSGSTEALREGGVGRLSGFDIFESQVFGYGPNDKGQADGVAFHRDAVALVTRTLERPMGLAANQVAIENYKGLGLRVVYAYDVDKKQDIISVDFLMGTKAMRNAAAVELDFGQGS